MLKSSVLARSTFVTMIGRIYVRDNDWTNLCSWQWLDESWFYDKDYHI